MGFSIPFIAPKIPIIQNTKNPKNRISAIVGMPNFVRRPIPKLRIDNPIDWRIWNEVKEFCALLFITKAMINHGHHK